MKPKRITLTERRRHHVYGAVHEAFMEARVEVAKRTATGALLTGRDVDDVLFDLEKKAGRAALDAMHEPLR